MDPISDAIYKYQVISDISIFPLLSLVTFFQKHMENDLCPIIKQN